MVYYYHTALLLLGVILASISAAEECVYNCQVSTNGNNCSVPSNIPSRGSTPATVTFRHCEAQSTATTTMSSSGQHRRQETTCRCSTPLTPPLTDTCPPPLGVHVHVPYITVILLLVLLIVTLVAQLCQVTKRAKRMNREESIIRTPNKMAASDYNNPLSLRYQHVIDEGSGIRPPEPTPQEATPTSSTLVPNASYGPITLESSSNDLLHPHSHPHSHHHSHPHPHHHTSDINPQLNNTHDPTPLSTNHGSAPQGTGNSTCESETAHSSCPALSNSTTSRISTPTPHLSDRRETTPRSSHDYDMLKELGKDQLDNTEEDKPETPQAV